MSLFSYYQNYLQSQNLLSDSPDQDHPNSGTSISSQGMTLIEYYEGLRLTAYLDTSGVWTIGYGHTDGVQQGQTITFDEAVAFLASDLQTATNGVIDNVIVVLEQNQIDALISFTYNIGVANFQGSTALKNINNGNLVPVPYDISLWNMSGGRVSPGLVNRRHSEAVLFSTGVLSLAPVIAPDDNQA